jgi:hypothetical protein
MRRDIYIAPFLYVEVSFYDSLLFSSDIYIVPIDASCDVS